MKKFIFGGILVLLLGGYALWTASRSSAGAPVQATSIPSETTNSNTANEDNGIGDASSPAPSGAYKDGTYTGSVGSAAPYGNVQVNATISGGKITAIKILQAPSGPGNTNAITATAFPKLIQEAIAIQSAKVDIVSGATQDSEGFQQSLGVALAAAQK